MSIPWTISATQIAAVRRAFPDAFVGTSEADVEDVAKDALRNNATGVRKVWAWGADEPYSIHIRGVPGAYFVSANEIDPAGVVSTRREADALLEEVCDGIVLFRSERAAVSGARRLGWI